MNVKKIFLINKFTASLLGILAFSFLFFFSLTVKADVYQPIYTKQKFVSSQKQIAEGYVDGVKTKFSTGGGFSWIDYGGPNRKVIGVPGYCPPIALGTTNTEKLGIKTTRVDVPDRTNYYRLYVKKHYVVNKYAQFGKTIFSDKEFFVKYVYEVNITNVEAFPKKS